ncbi:MAG: nicotinate-nucleotide adenylyltransferase [Anaerolineaceae bacterium]
MRIGIFGGTFDPPHLGHLILAAEAYDQLNLERLLWVLTPDPPHKQGMPIHPMEQRIEMVKAAMGDDPAFELSRIEIDRPGPHYAEDTVHLLGKEYPKAELFYLMGGDSLHALHTWHEPQAFIAACSGLGVMRRPGDEIDLKLIESLLPGISKKVNFIEAPLLEISARQIRYRIATQKPYRYYLPPAVYQLIQEKKYYLDDLQLD